jgi:hypothetical protein
MARTPDELDDIIMETIWSNDWTTLQQAKDYLTDTGIAGTGILATGSVTDEEWDAWVSWSDSNHPYISNLTDEDVEKNVNDNIYINKTPYKFLNYKNALVYNGRHTKSERYDLYVASASDGLQALINTYKSNMDDAWVSYSTVSAAEIQYTKLYE